MNENTILKFQRFFRNFSARILDTGVVRLSVSNSITTSPKLIRVFGHTINKKSNHNHVEQLPVIYLKINREAEYTIKCIQKWLDVIKCIGSEYYIVCDNKMLEYKILRHCSFKDENVKIIPSYRRNIESVVKYLFTGGWKNATRAHLTPFYHAKKYGYDHFWQIDADDTSILLHTDKIVNSMKQVQEIALNKNIAAISLDMWYSKTKGRHWSFGIAYFRNIIDWISLFESQNSNEWMKHFSHYGSMNLDWYFNYLKLVKKISIQSFYIDNCWFIHWGSFVMNPNSAWINYWQNGKAIYPIYKYVYFNEQLGEIDLCDDSIKIENGPQNDAKYLLENYIFDIRNMSKAFRTLHLIPDDFAKQDDIGAQTEC